MPEVSVIIPLYNCAPYIATAIRSVLAQTHRDFELIVVDDGSTDGSREAVAPFGNAVRLISQSNAGVAVARNRGLAEARGRFVAFLDADDWWHESKLALNLQAMSRFPSAGLVFSDFAVAGPDGHVIRNRGGIRWKYGVVRNERRTPWSSVFSAHCAVQAPSSLGEITSLDIYSGHLARWLFLGNLINTCSTFIRREVIDEVGLFDSSLSTEEDYEYWLRVARQWPMAYIDAPLLAFRQRPGQLTRSDQIERVIRNVSTVLERVAPHMGKHLTQNEIAGRRARLQRELGALCLRSGRARESRSLLWGSLRIQPNHFGTLGLLVLSTLPPKAYAHALRLFRRIQSSL